MDSHLNEVAGKLLQAANAASAEIKKYLDTRNDESRFMQDDVYRHILQVEKPYHILIGIPPAPMQEFKSDVVQFALRGKATTDPKTCLALVSVLGLELQRLGENKNFVLARGIASRNGFHIQLCPATRGKALRRGCCGREHFPGHLQGKFLMNDRQLYLRTLHIS